MNLKLSKANLIREVKDYFFISFGLFCYALGWVAFSASKSTIT